MLYKIIREWCMGFTYLFFYLSPITRLHHVNFLKNLRRSKRISQGIFFLHINEQFDRFSIPCWVNLYKISLKAKDVGNNHVSACICLCIESEIVLCVLLGFKIWLPLRIFCSKYCFLLVYCAWWFKFRLNAQALTLAALTGAAILEYYDHKTRAEDEKYSKYFNIEDFNSRKD